MYGEEFRYHLIVIPTILLFHPFDAEVIVTMRSLLLTLTLLFAGNTVTLAQPKPNPNPPKTDIIKAELFIAITNRDLAGVQSAFHYPTLFSHSCSWHREQHCQRQSFVQTVLHPG